MDPHVDTENDAEYDHDVERRPLKLLALDGGGIRGFSELKMLQVLMHRIQWDKQLASPPRPCEYFDLIGGTSTGGIIAILLGRLRFTVDRCLEIYASLSKEVFGNQRWGFGVLQSKFDHRILERVIIKELEKELTAKSPIEARNAANAVVSTGVAEAEQPDVPADPADLMMYDNYTKPCKAFVTATPGRDAQKGAPHLFRTYIAREQGTQAGPDCKVWEAIRATSAAPTFFDPIKIGDELFVDGGFGCNNPVNWVYEEARKMWPDREIGCIISLGTGMPRVLSLQNPTFKDSRWPMGWVQVLERTATECDTAHQEMLRKKELRGKYFRFNVQQGLQGVSLMEWEKLGETASLTEAYLREVEVERKMNAVVDKLVALDDWIDVEAPWRPRRQETDELPTYSRATQNRDRRL